MPESTQTISQGDPWLRMRVAAREMHKMFRTHPAEAGETYMQHLWFTVSMSARFLLVSIILLIHGMLPFLFTHTGSRLVEKIHVIMKERAMKTQGNSADMYDI